MKEVIILKGVGKKKTKEKGGLSLMVKKENKFIIIYETVAN